MPLYTVSTQRGVLTGEARAALAEELTAFHCGYSGVPRTWVHVIFQEYAPGNGYTAGKAAAAAALTLLIRTGRSVEYKRGLIKLPGRHTRPGRSDRRRNSRSATQPGHGDGADHARGDKLLNRLEPRPPRHRSTPTAPLRVSDWTGRPAVRP
jgi:phenylpyruvate tautomerase PptA (4-oxalocrotonate tautomerase family)